MHVAQQRMFKMKITRRQLRTIIKEALGDRGDLPKKHQYKIGMQGPEDLPYGNVTGSKSTPPRSKAEYKWLEWGEGYGLNPEEDNEGQLLFYFDLNDDVDGTIANEAEIMGGSIEPASYPPDGNVVVYTDVYTGEY